MNSVINKLTSLRDRQAREASPSAEQGERCVFANIIGGLGNQMFQYAFARALSLRHQTSLKLVTDMFDNYNLHHGFELQKVFGIRTPIASKKDLSDVLGWRKAPRVRRLAAKLQWPFLMPASFIAEQSFRFRPVSWETPGSVYVQGYWQSAKHFEGYAETIRSDFKFAEPLTKPNLALAEELCEGTTVSVHVRRGDYVDGRGNHSIHATCPPEYYALAIERILSQLPGARFFAFSDDPGWVKENLGSQVQSMRVVEHNNGSEGHVDMRLMSLCKHHIIANSTFSWWAAWLNARNDKIVIGPKSWFVSPQIHSIDLFPPSWMRV